MPKRWSDSPYLKGLSLPQGKIISIDKAYRQYFKGIFIQDQIILCPPGYLIQDFFTVPLQQYWLLAYLTATVARQHPT